MIPTVRAEEIDPNKIIIKETVEESKILDIRESIKIHGLLHPPLIKDNFEIIAGKARVLAARGVLESITCKVYPSDLDDLDYKAIALHENLKRYNLPWYEQVIKEKELHDLRQAQHGIGKPGAKVGWSIRDTAKELSNMAIGTLSEDLRLAEAILADPNLKRIEDKTTARKVIFETIKRVNQEIGSSRPVNFEVNSIHCGGSEEILKVFDDDTFDACITDPPWLEFKDKNLVKDEFTLKVFTQIYRVLKQNAFLYAFVSTQDWYFYYDELQKIGFSVQKWPLIWIKEGVLTYGRRSWEYQRDYEHIILAAKGSPAVTSSMLSSVFSCKVVPSAKMIHPNEKPIEVIRRLIDNCSYDGSLILDPFAGSFVVPYVCKLSNRRFIAIEKDKKYFMQGKNRLGL